MRKPRRTSPSRTARSRRTTRSACATRGACLSLLAALATALAPTARAAEPRGFLETMKRHNTLTSTVPANGDQNPYAIVVAPVSAGKIQKDDVLVDNFNDRNNLQGLGST